MRNLTPVCLLLSCLFSLLIAESAEAQPIRKTLNDYWWGKPFTYQPSDPFERSKLYQIHTKHYGMFYNCDDEECKRNSPYICWKNHWERDTPNWMRPLERVRHEAAQIRQRIYDGAGPCLGQPGCNCAECQMADVAPMPSSSCPDCQGASPMWSAQTKSRLHPASNARSIQQSVAKYERPTTTEGLIRQPEPRIVQAKDVVSGRTVQPPRSTSLLSRLQATRSTEVQPAPVKEPASRTAGLRNPFRMR